MKENEKSKDDRFRKYKTVNDMYASRCFTQQQLAEKLNMTLYGVKKTLKKHNYWHTICRDTDNEFGIPIDMVTAYEELTYLDKYQF